MLACAGYVAVIEPGSPLRAAECSITAVVHLHGHGLALSHKKASEVHHFWHRHIRIVAAYGQGYGYFVYFSGCFVGVYAEAEVVVAVDKFSTVGCHAHVLCVAFAHTALRGGENELFAPVGIVAACRYGPAERAGVGLVHAAFQRRGQLRPCAAHVVAHVAVAFDSGVRGVSHAEGVSFLSGFEMHHYPEGFAGSEEQLLVECYGIVVGKPVVAHFLQQGCRGYGNIAFVYHHLRIHTVGALDVHVCEVESFRILRRIHAEPLCHGVGQGLVRLADVGP